MYHRNKYRAYYVNIQKTENEIFSFFLQILRYIIYKYSLLFYLCSDDSNDDY